jgi:hypothetical protein
MDKCYLCDKKANKENSLNIIGIGTMSYCNECWKVNHYECFFNDDPLFIKKTFMDKLNEFIKRNLREIVLWTCLLIVAALLYVNLQ